MKTLKWFLLLATVLVLPVVVWKKMRRVNLLNDENIRYDINDYMADQGL
jgi:hypothetical protein